MAIITKQGNTQGMYKGNCLYCGCEFLWGGYEYLNGGVRCPQCGAFIPYMSPYYYNVPQYTPPQNFTGYPPKK